ncbi:TetR family transcriptional regulator [Kitasatospora sp. NPDC048540]|uniref:TetR/AcrR family transcriptional regulator n=1 Tax=unclassified Kitasatospora TaxID=2633591 RepID=UPI00053AEA9A|nr:TetR family transcriptional regulator [Kitasatospora sp. MBT63]
MPKPPETRDRIIAAALRIIGKEGVSGLTNRRIATEAAVALGSVTYHFASQHDLLRESLRAFVAEETRRFTELAEQADTRRIDLPGAAAAVRRLAIGPDLAGEHTASFELYLQAGRDTELQEAAAECFAAYDQLATSIMRALGVENAERLAKAAVAMVCGLQLRHLATGTAGDDLVEALLLLAGDRPG